MVLVHFTILEDVVRNSMDALSDISTQDKSTSPIIVGGMAVQLHCPERKELLRPTGDIDLLYLPRISDYQEFARGLGGEMQNALRARGYQVQLKRTRSSYEVKIMKGQQAKAQELFFVHFECLPQGQQDNLIDKREAENSVELGEREKSIYVIRIEDIIPRKIRRIRRVLEEQGEKADPLHRSLYKLADSGDWGKLAQYTLEDWCTAITTMQAGFSISQKVPPRDYVINKDLYDLCLLARKVDGQPHLFNRSYYSVARSQIDAI